MALGKTGWLERLIRDGVTKHRADRESRSMREALALPPGRGRARRYLRGILRESGLLFGTPQVLALGAEGAGPEEQLFVAVLPVFTRVAIHLAWLV